MIYKKAHCYLYKLATVLLLFLSINTGASALVVNNVSADRYHIEPGQAVAINFAINQPARVSVSVYDARNYLVSTLMASHSLIAGEHKVTWNGLDNKRKPVPSGFYHYTVTAVGNNSEKVVNDLTDVTGGETVTIINVRYDAKNERVYYQVPNTARVFLRVGVEGTFVAKTLLNGVVRKAGKHSIHWDGWDRSRVLNLKHHPKLKFHGDGYRPSRNTITVLNTQQEHTQSHWLPLSPKNNHQRVPTTKRRGLNIHAYHSPEYCHDIAVSLTLPDNLPKENGIPVLSTPTPLRVSLANKDTLRMEAERGEVVFFLDNQLIYENEASFFPYTWTWNKKKPIEGIHYLTGFVLGFENHFGVSTLKVKLNNHPKTASTNMEQ